MDLLHKTDVETMIIGSLMGTLTFFEKKKLYKH